MVEVRAYEAADVAAMAGVWNEVVRDGNTRFDWFLNSGTSQTKVQKVNQRGLPLSVH